MINELYELSKVMERYGVQEESYALNYNEVSYKECICVTLDSGEVLKLSQILNMQKAVIRNYTETSSGGFPCVKLAPLYFIHDKNLIQLISAMKKTTEKMDSETISMLRDACTVHNNNWTLNENFINRKYKKALALAGKMHDRLARDHSEAFDILFQELGYFTDPNLLHDKLTKFGLQMLKNIDHVDIALNMLFNCVEKDQVSKVNCGELSILFNAEKLYEHGTPVTSSKFTEELNAKLISAERNRIRKDKSDSFDAFHLPYTENDTPMPNVKIGAGFYVKIRTMNPDACCLHRYGKEGSATFSASHATRERLQQALFYIGKAENKDKTWICIDALDGKPRDILFAYPSSLPKKPVSFTAMFKQNSDKSIAFSSQARQFIQELKQTKEIGTDSNAKWIAIFVLRRIDSKTNSGRTKVVYTRQTDPYELEKCSEAWTLGCANLPAFPFGAPRTLYPLDIADILNRFWKQTGEVATDKFKPFSQYHGIEILMDSELSVSAGLHRLSEGAMSIGSFFGTLSAKDTWSQPMQEKAKDMLALMGLFLYRGHIGKDTYMENLPYLYGQLLKAADELHVLYCKVVRNGEVPPQLVGSTLFQSAAEAPIRTLNVLRQRIMPYYAWAKSYRLKGITDVGKESWRAGWLYRICEQTADKLQNSWTPQTRFIDEEKAQLFIGYLAAFPKKELSEKNSEEVSTNE